ncbi:MAG: M48 family metalloprotease [Clostridia bacterium]|nr:M48 family metalloprotease [Clostridia bacterium]
MYEDIRSNKIRTGVIVSIFIVVVTLIIYYICMAFDLGIISIVIALVFSCLTAWASYYNSDKIVLSMSKARPATHEENQKLVNILDALVVSSGLGITPKLYVVEDIQPNAFATGRDPQHSVICVTTGLLEKLDYYELEGVIRT